MQDETTQSFRLAIDGLYDGPTVRMGDQVAFVAQTDRIKIGVRSGTLDGEAVRLMISFVRGQERARPPMLIATILP